MPRLQMTTHDTIDGGNISLESQVPRTMFSHNAVGTGKQPSDLDKRNVSAEAQAPSSPARAANRFSRHRYAIAAFVIIALNACMRLALIAHDWPQTNSDEGTVGLMALHIAYHGGHPSFLYGQGS